MKTFYVVKSSLEVVRLNIACEYEVFEVEPTNLHPQQTLFEVQADSKQAAKDEIYAQYELEKIQARYFKGTK